MNAKTVTFKRLKSVGVITLHTPRAKSNIAAQMAEEMAQRLEGVVCTIKAKVSEEDRLYGSVSVRDIIDALGEQNVVVEKRMVLLKEPIKPRWVSCEPTI